MNRKEFLTTVVCGGTGAIACGAAPCCGMINQTGGATDPDKSKLEERAKFADAWITRLMTVIDLHLDPSSREKLMESIGRSCYVSQHGPRPADIPAGSLDRLVARLKKWAGEEGLHREGNTVHLVYGPAGTDKKHCLCPMVENVSAGLSPTYCHCSIGYVKEMFEQATGKPVQVALTESLKRGGKRCRFRVQV